MEWTQIVFLIFFLDILSSPKPPPPRLLQISGFDFHWGEHARCQPGTKVAKGQEFIKNHSDKGHCSNPDFSPVCPHPLGFLKVPSPFSSLQESASSSNLPPPWCSSPSFILFPRQVLGGGGPFPCAMGRSALCELPYSIHLSRAYHVQGIALGTEDAAVSRTDKNPCLHGAYTLERKAVNARSK